MKRPSSYNTKQREAVLSYIISLKNTYITAAQIVNHFQNEDISIGRTTIYRHLDKLVQAEKLRKYNVDGAAGACFQYNDSKDDPQKHLLLKCEDCGDFFHLNCDVVNEVYQHIHQEHTFNVNTAKTVFYGKCESCQ